MRCASPPESVRVARSSVRYVSPTSHRKRTRARASRSTVSAICARCPSDSVEPARRSRPAAAPRRRCVRPPRAPAAPRAAACAPPHARTLRALVLPQEDADVLLVALLLEASRNGRCPRSRVLAVQQLLAGRAGSDFHGASGDAERARENRPRGAAAFVARLRPRIDGPVAHRALGVGHDERLVVVERGAEPVAGGAGPARVVEREELRRGRGARVPSLGHSKRSVKRQRDTGPVGGGPSAGGGTTGWGRAAPRRRRLRERPSARHRRRRAAARVLHRRRSITTSTSDAAARSTRLPRSSRCMHASPRPTRTKPRARRFSAITACVTLSERTSGQATMKRVPVGQGEHACR
jgi:hypothetical protein